MGADAPVVDDGDLIAFVVVEPVGHAIVRFLVGEADLAVGAVAIGFVRGRWSFWS